jgi:glycosyltransferase involved in cell wall biosynthesis
VRPLTILQTCFSPSWGGLELQALEVSRHLLARGHRLTLACPPSTRLAQEASDIPTLLLRVHGYVHPFLVARLAQEIRHREITIIHCQHSRDLATVVPAMLLSGRRPALLLSKRVGSYIQKKDVLHRLTHRPIDRILAVSDVIHRNVLETLPISPDRVLTLHDAIDTVRFSPRSPGMLRRELGIDEGALLIGFVGRFSPGKGHEELMRAASMLRPRYPDVRYLVVGEASYGEEDYAREVRALARQLGVDDLVIFAGFRRDIPEVMAALDVFAFPSHAESFGVVLIEAMAMERPSVSTNCDGVLDIMVDGETGFMVPPKNAQALAHGLARLLEDPALRQRIGKASRQRVLKFFDRERQIDRLEEIYEQVVTEDH